MPSTAIPHCSGSSTDHIEIVNDHEVLWHLTKPEAELFWIISQMSAGGLEIQSADHFAELAGGDPNFRPAYRGRSNSRHGPLPVSEPFTGAEHPV